MEVLFEIFIAIATPIIIYGIYIIVSGKGRTIEMQAKIAEKKMRDVKKKEERKKKREKFFKIFDDVWAETYGQFFDHSN